MGPLTLFLTGQGVLLLGALAAAVVLLWDWRVALGALLVLQIGLAALAVGIEEVPAQIMFVQTIIIFLCCIMLATSGIQARMNRSGRQSGGWLFRLLVLGLLGAALSSLDLTFVLPEVAPAIARLFAWLGLLALVMLSLGDNPLFTSVALLMWAAIGYAVAAFYAPLPGVLIGIGLVELTLGLTCSYLILAERLPRLRAGLAQSDLDLSDDFPPELEMEPIGNGGRVSIPHPLRRAAQTAQPAPQAPAAPQAAPPPSRPEGTP